MFRRCLFLLLLSWSLLAQADNLLVLGDSISAGYGLDKPEQGWVALLHERLRPRGLEVVNASISGDTTAGGLQRLDALLERVKPAWVLVELGGNDGLRGLTPAQMEANLTQIIGKSGAAGARVLLLGMRIPPNYGKRYAEMFQSIYGKVAAAQNVALVPFLLDGVGGEDGLMQQDGIHPYVAAQPLMLEQVWKVLEPLLAAGDKPASNPTKP
jgi:acyl-CoA thioesterase-1